MKPDAIYYFDRMPERETHYKQIGHRGKKIPEFPAVYKNGKHEGEKYIVFRKTSNYYNQNDLRFTHAIETAKDQIITGLFFMPEYPRQAYGAYKNFGILIEFSKDFARLAIWFFKGLQEAAPILFQKKQAGEIPEIAKTEVVKLRYGADSLDV